MNTQILLVNLRQFLLILHFYPILIVIEYFSPTFFPKESRELREATDTFWYQSFG